MNNQYPSNPWAQRGAKVPVPPDQSFDDGAAEYAQQAVEQAIEASAQRMPLNKTGRTRNVVPPQPIPSQPIAPPAYPDDEGPLDEALMEAPKARTALFQRPAFPKVQKFSFPATKFAERLAVASLTFAVLYLAEGAFAPEIYSKISILLSPAVMSAIFLSCFLFSARNNLKNWVTSIFFVLKSAIACLLENQLLFAWILGYFFLTAWLG